MAQKGVLGLAVRPQTRPNAALGQRAAEAHPGTTQRARSPTTRYRRQLAEDPTLAKVEQLVRIPVSDASAVSRGVA